MISGISNVGPFDCVFVEYCLFCDGGGRLMRAFSGGCRDGREGFAHSVVKRFRVADGLEYSLGKKQGVVEGVDGSAWVCNRNDARVLGNIIESIGDVDDARATGAMVMMNTKQEYM